MPFATSTPQQAGIPARPPWRRAGMAIGALVVLGAVAGCEQQRTTNNPFVGPSGAAIEQPYGAGVEGSQPDGGLSRP